jgi:hypothetical protein
MANALQSLADFGGDHRSVNMFGAAGNGTTDDTSAIQSTIQSAVAMGYKYVLLPAGSYLISNTIWVPSGLSLIGFGGRTKVTRIKRANGMYVDSIVAGVWDGASHARDTYSTWEGGLPYSYTKGSPAVSGRGSDISIQGIYIQGNSLNAGTHPLYPNPPLADYRGCGIYIQWVDGVLIDDVCVEDTPNSGIEIHACRRVTCVNGITSDVHLYNQIPATLPAKNGLTIAGTMASVDSDSSDKLIVNNWIASGNDDLGVAIQARYPATSGDAPPDPVFGGAIIVSNIATSGNGAHGVAIEGEGQSGSDNTCVDSVVISNIVSSEDGSTGLAAVGINYQATNVSLSGVVVKDSGGTGLVISGWKNIIVSDVIVNGYCLAVAAGFIPGVWIYKETDTPTNLQYVALSNITVLGGSGRAASTIGLALNQCDQLFLSNIRIDGTTMLSAASGEGSGLFISACAHASVDGLYCVNAGGNGVEVVVAGELRLANFDVLDYAQSAFSPAWRSGVSVSGAGRAILSHGLIKGQAVKETCEYDGLQMTGISDLDLDDITIERVSRNGAYLISDGTNIRIHDIRVINYGNIADLSGGCAAGIWVLRNSGTPRVSINGGMITGGSGKAVNTEGIRIGATCEVGEIDGVTVDGTTFIAAYSGAGAGIENYASTAAVKNCRTVNCADAGIFIGDVPRFSVDNCISGNNGMAATGTYRAGIFAAPGTGARHGRISGNLCYDSQGTATQQYGIQVPNTADEYVDVTGNKCWGNAVSSLNGEITGSGNRVWGNDFDQASKGMSMAGTGGYDSNLMQLGSYRLWVQAATNKLRIKSGAPTTDADGTLVGELADQAGHAGQFLKTNATVADWAQIAAGDFAAQNANKVLGGPVSGGDAAPTFRALVSADIPNNAANTSGTAGALSATLAVSLGGTAATTEAAARTSLDVYSKAEADALVKFTDRGDPAAADKAITGLTVDSAWHDWDVSALAPAGSTALILRVSMSNNGTNGFILFRKNGNSNEANVGAIGAPVANVTSYASVTVACDANRVIEYLVGNNGTYAGLNIVVAGYLK